MIKYYYIFISWLVASSASYGQDLSINFTKIEAQCLLAEASVTINSGALPIHYLWSNGSISNSIDQLEEGDYWVKVKDDHNNDTTVYFTIEKIICVPSAETHFTPNSDGFNDTWSISRIENFPDFDLSVYNRWGQQVHHQSNLYIPWDGKSIGLPLPDATYYYIIYLSRSDNNKFIKGDISIIR